MMMMLMMSVPVPVIDWIDSSPVTCW